MAGMRGAHFAAASALMLATIASVGWYHASSPGSTELAEKPGQNLLAVAIKDLVTDKATVKPKAAPVKPKKEVRTKEPHDFKSHLPNLEEMAIMQLFTKPKHPIAEHNKEEKAAAAAQPNQKPSSELGTVAAVQKYRDQQKRDAMLEKEKMEREEGLPAFGTHQYKVALAKAQLDENWAKLKIAKLRQRRDSTIANFQAFEQHGYKQAQHLKRTLAFREQREIKQAKSLQEQAKKATSDVIRDLNVQDGKFDIHQWYRSEAARKASEDSTQDVQQAKRMWGAAMRDRQRLKTLEERPVFREHEEKLSSAEVALRVSKKLIAQTKARLAGYRQRLSDLRSEAPTHPAHHVPSPPAAPAASQSAAAAALAPAAKTEGQAPVAARAQEAGEEAGLEMAKQTVAAGTAAGKAAAAAAAANAGVHVAKEAEGEGSAQLRADEERGEAMLAEEMEGGGKGRLEELASSEAAVLKAEKPAAQSKQQGLRQSTGQQVADLVYEQAAVHKRLEKEAYRHQKLPLLQRKLIFNW